MTGIHVQPENLTGDATAAPPTRDDGTPLTRRAWECLRCDTRWSRLLLDAVNNHLELGRSTREGPSN